ncbi:hypothetical protein Tsubulata_049021 [Turnera subulata]|uniref:Uncharacterized protein n=1 Tax=Turnera subulata TaxID=218843 RepID=A0A9Q0JQR2_9ROSI|nr:hypothetical protein Tsubulata_049021 [Turnera subulata]
MEPMDVAGKSKEDAWLPKAHSRNGIGYQGTGYFVLVLYNHISTVPDMPADYKPHGQNGFFKEPTGRFSAGRVIVDSIEVIIQISDFKTDLHNSDFSKRNVDSKIYIPVAPVRTIGLAAPPSVRKM